MSRSLDNKKRERPGKRRRQKKRSGSPPGARRAKLWRDVKIFAALIAVSLATALLAGFLMNMDMQAATNFFLFGSMDPYISSGKRKVIEKELRDEMKKMMK